MFELILGSLITLIFFYFKERSDQKREERLLDCEWSDVINRHHRD